ncbi:MAG: HEPN domain-containing protein [Candidatus Woesearchaeota archaeon]|nr:HEPN domain-containing protein [Candidatus Woesearchaeota archaeon]
MDSKAEMYIKRAKTELETAEILYTVSKEKPQNFNISPESTYYSGTISHSYYAIFYSAKAMLLTKNIETKAPEIHKKTLDEFEKEFIQSGLLDARLLIIYKQMIIRAETLLEIFKTEKRKRGDFTYNTIPQANIEPAQESIKNAKEFIKHCNTYLIQA